MKRMGYVVAAAFVAGNVLGHGQEIDVTEILANVRQALGGPALERLESLVIEGATARPGPNGTTERGFEISVQRPDKYMRKEVMAALGNMSVYRQSGFNGVDGLIDEVDQPPQLNTGGRVMVFRAGPGDAPGSATPTPEEREAQRQARLLAIKQDYARLTLGMFAAAPSVYPLEFTYVSRAESPDGAAHVIGVKGDGGFDVRLFIDAKTHMPLMLSWMDKEPLPMVAQTMQISGSISREEMQKRAQEREAQMREAEAARQVVEYRYFYGDYKRVNGVMIPHRFQRTAAGKVIDETTFGRIRVNTRIDEDRFRVSKPQS